MGLAAEMTPDAPEPRPEVLFARQPIIDSEGRLAGYELFYRGETPKNPHAATSQIAVSALSDLGLEVATGGAPAFLNVTSEFLIEMDPLPFGPDRVVLEISAERTPTEELLERLGRLREHGYQIALDGYAAQPTATALIGFCSMVKMDARSLTPMQMKTVMPFLQGKGVRLNDAAVESDTLAVNSGNLGADGALKLSAGKKRHALVKPA